MKLTEGVTSTSASGKPSVTIRPITPSSNLSTPVATPTPTPTIDEKMSRSGRVIKPKKFVDESPENSPMSVSFYFFVMRKLFPSIRFIH